MPDAFEYAQRGGFPSFAPLFSPSKRSNTLPYMALLSLIRAAEVRFTIHLVRQAIAASPAPRQEIIALLADYDWRPHLIGSLSILVDVADNAMLGALWEAFDSGSWVSPQLAATAFLSDPDFEAHARQRIEAGCPINRERLAGLDWAVRHSAAGPGSFADHSAKALAALVALCQDLPSAKTEGSWLEQALAQKTPQSILASDRDEGGEIAVGWRQDIELLLREALE